MSLLGHKKEAEHETVLNLLRPFHFFSQRSVCINTSTFCSKWQHPRNVLALTRRFFSMWLLRLHRLRTTDQEHISLACSFSPPPGLLSAASRKAVCWRSGFGPLPACVSAGRAATTAASEGTAQHELDRVSPLVLYHYTNLIIALI